MNQQSLWFIDDAITLVHDAEGGIVYHPARLPPATADQWLATLRALGVGLADLRRIVLEQALWVGGGGLVLAVAVGALLLALADAAAVPVAVDAGGAALVAALVLLVALGSGLLAMRSLRRADPITLLR